MQKGIAKAHV